MTQLGDYRAFLTQFLRNYETTGSIIPSGRALATALSRHVGQGDAPQRILEAGPGTGAVTRCIVERMRHDDQTLTHLAVTPKGVVARPSARW